jgi:hypothetical protein
MESVGKFAALISLSLSALSEEAAESVGVCDISQNGLELWSRGLALELLEQVAVAAAAARLLRGSRCSLAGLG